MAKDNIDEDNDVEYVDTDNWENDINEKKNTETHSHNHVESSTEHKHEKVHVVSEETKESKPSESMSTANIILAVVAALLAIVIIMHIFGLGSITGLFFK